MSRQHFTYLVLGGLLTTVVLVAAPLTAAENDNPFARWESIKAITDGAEAQADQIRPATPRKGSVEYFSASSPRPVAIQDSPLQSTGPRKVHRERLTVTSAVNVDKRGGGVVTAGFVDTRDGQSHIRRTSGESSSSNPFVEFLAPEGSEEQADAEAPAFDVPAAAEPAERPEVPMPSDAAQPDFQIASNSDTMVPTTVIPPTPIPTSTGPQTGAVSVAWEHTNDLTVGQECECRLIVKNVGEAAVRDIDIEAVLPHGLQVVSSDPAPSAAADSATWQLAQLAAGEEQTIKLVIIPAVEGDLGLTAHARFVTSGSSILAVRQPRLEVAVSGPDAVEVGQIAHYEVRVSNPGSGETRNVVIQAAIPEGLEHRHGSRLSIEIGTLSPGEVRRARLTVTGITGGDQPLAVRAVADADLTDEIVANVSVAEPRLNIGLRGALETTVGQAVSYEIVILNEGKVASNNVRAKFRMPADSEFLSADAGGKENQADGTVDWFVGTVDPGQARHFIVRISPGSAGQQRLQAGVISEHGGVNVAEHQTEVLGKAELKMELAASQDTVPVGGEPTFEVKVTNVGSSAAANIGLSCELPSGLKLLKIAGPSKYIEDNGAVVFRALPTLEAGESAVFALKTACTRPGRQSIRVRVASESLDDALIDETATIGQDQ